jgi:hypothetical protein
MTVSEDEALIAALEAEEEATACEEIYENNSETLAMLRKHANLRLYAQNSQNSRTSSSIECPFDDCLVTCLNDADCLSYITQFSFVICHFFHPSYEHCLLMDRHLSVCGIYETLDDL